MIARLLGILALTVGGCAKESTRAGDAGEAHIMMDAPAAAPMEPAAAPVALPEEADAGPAEQSAAEAAEEFDRDEIAEPLDAVKPHVVKCMQAAPELGGARYMQVSIRIGASGSVAYVKMKDPSHVGTPLETCTTKAVKKARFRRTKTGATVNYPFRLP